MFFQKPTSQSVFGENFIELDNLLSGFDEICEEVITQNIRMASQVLKIFDGPIRAHSEHLAQQAFSARRGFSTVFSTNEKIPKRDECGSFRNSYCSNDGNSIVQDWSEDGDDDEPPDVGKADRRLDN
ncbi:hypothetical protein L3Y34_012386 [Caenorhabditis briggsae]|uniref:Uncharacterized protein n=1 Tax=Caenorhabditis briggsae TaxID=6238 RepID=A0AAE8ZSI1_CAEBR|nr:hypothetical protein L3Y34_012386 [Caenorhabditis briggsae]